MDIHIIPGVKARDVAEAHRQDMLLQGEHECQCMTYWIDEERENVFCLIEAPDKDAVIAMHHKAHGLVPHKIIEVNRNLVESFLGRIYDPENVTVTAEGLKVFTDPSFRILLLATTKDPVLLRYEMGIDKANDVLYSCTQLIRQNLALFNGREVEYPGTDFIASFTSASHAVACALAIRQAAQQEACLKISINAGEPVATNNALFGNTIQFARQLCFTTDNTSIALASVVKEMVAKDHPREQTPAIHHLSLPDENILQQIFHTLETNWQNPGFTVTEFSMAMTMSQSQLYRKTMELTKLSPNILLKTFRLEKARELMREKQHTIAQITFDTGFTSPSYFTRCFKNAYGLLPITYTDLL
ncbi:DNA-binding response regulator, AraC family [Filimonas lacunae]|nr:DNA-binding response regulator, AraC family [Filimonas lacunae]